ncbi:MAG: (deoxy)nucleoside triphosphate pyrophosphohydrolase [Clostridia bacterium]|nr:(deoxy)nucleoside triphosphate pyrophosphohydrolase [Clostridia bacterium]
MQEIHVVGAAIREGDKFLVAQRSERMNSPLKWEFVGGKVEQEEKPESALKREVMEELGIGIDVGRFVASGTSIIGEKKIILHVYEARITEGKPMAKEHASLKWVKADEMKTMDFAEPDLPAVTLLSKGSYE